MTEILIEDIDKRIATSIQEIHDLRNFVEFDLNSWLALKEEKREEKREEALTMIDNHIENLRKAKKFSSAVKEHGI